MTSDAERRPAGQILGRLRSQRVATVLELVEAQVAGGPARSALRDPRRELSYAETWALAGLVAERIRVAGAARGATIALCGNRSVELIVGLLGILRAGAAYVPLDTSYPAERLGFMLDDSRADVVVGHGRAVRALPSGERRIVSLDDLAARAEREPAFDPPEADDLCYVIYTSGSTGTPKGAMLEHGGLANLIEWQLSDSPPGAHERTLQFSPISFDVSFQEIFSTLGAGGTLVCVPEEHRADPQALWAYLAEERITRLFLPFVALQALALFADDLPEGELQLREIVTAGEQLQCNDNVRRLFERVPGCALVNQYGPAETHVVSRHRLSGPPSAWPTLPPIGEPIDNVRLYVCDEDGTVVPAAGESGELCIAGAAVGRGYRGRADLTAERFVDEPSGSGARMYRTGDLARVRPDGQLDFLGRRDDQVKVRGYRIEPAEIEAEIVRHPRVREAAVVVERAAATEKRLVAAVTGELDPGVGPELRRFLGERLPAFMIPGRFVVVSELPRLPSGKLDRRAAAASVGPERRVAAGPATLAGPLAAAVEAVLGEDADLSLGFLGSGHDSLAAARLAALLLDKTSRAVPVSAILASASLEDLAARVAVAPIATASRSRRRGRDLPVSGVQLQMLLDEQLNPGERQLLVAFELALRGAVDIGRLRAALRVLVDRHGSLRTRYWFDDTDFRQEIVPLAALDVSMLEARDPAELDAIRRAALSIRFDLLEPCRPRLTLVRTGPDDHCLLAVMHHISCDGWSLNVLVRELVELYSASVEGRRPELLEPPQFVDVAALGQETDSARLHKACAELAGVREVSFRGEAASEDRGGGRRVERLPLALGRGISSDVRRRAASERVTAFALLLAACATVLSSDAGASEVTIAVPMAARGTPEAFRAVGAFSNTVVVKAAVDLREPGIELVRRLHDALLRAHDVQGVPFVEVVRAVAPRREPRRHPLARVMLAFQPRLPRRFALAGGVEATVSFDLGVPDPTGFDVVLDLVDFEDEISGWLDYNTDLFTDAAVKRIGKEYRAVLERLVSDPRIPLDASRAGLAVSGVAEGGA